jgi:hypothetical protein
VCASSTATLHARRFLEQGEGKRKRPESEKEEHKFWSVCINNYHLHHSAQLFPIQQAPNLCISLSNDEPAFLL